MCRSTGPDAPPFENSPKSSNSCKQTSTTKQNNILLYREGISSTSDQDSYEMSMAAFWGKKGHYWNASAVISFAQGVKELPVLRIIHQRLCFLHQEGRLVLQ